MAVLPPKMSKTARALITGSTKGIGLAIAKELSQRGYALVLNYHTDEAAAARAQEELSPICRDLTIVRADVTTEDGADSLFAAADKRGPVDLLVNNVGQFLYKPFLETSIEEWRAVIESSLFGAVLCCQRVLPGMRQQGAGLIINIAVMHADRFRPRPHTLPYAVAKSGIVHLTKTLAKTEGPHGIRVNAVCPGFVDGGEHTRSQDKDRVPLGRLAQPEDVAHAVGFLASDEADYITGAILEVHGGALL